ncbi:Outer membrane protein beta-barrel domain-containing protein [Chryseobacterium taeanense]|uniref:Outer membrane protein beta-barrel domain-containing protein n=1 Tax=Chryseobacterium taeanense TaxID=311334 RepID=A0A1G8M9V4_9FLAO|nr:porin family protein [Chryseobacterium taeanense]SDI64627.1 Outer membrane protein beta-barrel domain-containing protein [Chryseobacterium taeanense]
MKKFLLLASFAVMGMSVNAQEFRFGPKAGFAMSTLKIDEKQDDLGKRNMDPKYTFYIGGMAEYKINDNFGFQAEVLYSPLGGKEKIDGVNAGPLYVGEQTKVNLGTLLVPISAKYFITENFSVAAGANFGIILTAKQKTVIGSDFMDMEIEGDNGEMDIKDDIKKLNIAPFVGVEYMLENGLFFDARYSLGVSNLSNDGSGGKVTNSFAQIGVGFKFGGN